MLAITRLFFVVLVGQVAFGFDLYPWSSPAPEDVAIAIDNPHAVKLAAVLQAAATADGESLKKILKKEDKAKRWKNTGYTVRVNSWDKSQPENRRVGLPNNTCIQDWSTNAIWPVVLANATAQENGVKLLENGAMEENNLPLERWIYTLFGKYNKPTELADKPLYFDNKVQKFDSTKKKEIMMLETKAETHILKKSYAYALTLRDGNGPNITLNDPSIDGNKQIYIIKDILDDLERLHSLRLGELRR